MADRMRFAYADPPYIGQARKHYGPDAKEVNHEALIGYLNTFDAWALSCSTPSLRTILPLCPEDVRIGAWCKPFASYKPGVNPGYCWEPVIFFGGRSAVARGGKSAPTVRDYCETHEPDYCCAPAVKANITLKRGTHGAKPEAFCFWLFDVLGVHAADEFTDVFPGSGAVTRAWKEWSWHNAEASA